jgi:hypothetical protein
MDADHSCSNACLGTSTYQALDMGGQKFRPRTEHMNVRLRDEDATGLVAASLRPFVPSNSWQALALHPEGCGTGWHTRVHALWGNKVLAP